MANPPYKTLAKNHPLSGPVAARFVDNTARTVVNITASLGSPIDVNSVDDPGVIPDDGYIHQDPGGSFDRSEYYADRQQTITLAGGGSDCTASIYFDGNNDVDAPLQIALVASTPVSFDPRGDQITRVTTDVAPNAIITIVSGDTLCTGCRGVTLITSAAITVRLVNEEYDATGTVTAAKPITLPAGDNYRNIAQAPAGGIAQAGAQLFW